MFQPSVPPTVPTLCRLVPTNADLCFYLSVHLHLCLTLAASSAHEVHIRSEGGGLSLTAEGSRRRTCKKPDSGQNGEDHHLLLPLTGLMGSRLRIYVPEVSGACNVQNGQRVGWHLSVALLQIMVMLVEDPPCMEGVQRTGTG